MSSLGNPNLFLVVLSFFIMNYNTHMDSRIAQSFVVFQPQVFNVKFKVIC